jgi:hypothetical protein
MGWTAGVQFPAEAMVGFFFFFRHRIQTGSGAHPAICLIGTRCSLPGEVKLTTRLHLALRSRMHGAIPPLPHMPSWRGAQLKHRDNCNCTLFTSCNLQTSSAHIFPCDFLAIFETSLTHTIIWSEKLKGLDHLEDLSADEKIILE